MTDSDVIAITQVVNLYGLAVDSQRWNYSTGSSPPMWMPTTVRLRTGPIAGGSNLISRRFSIPSIPLSTQCPPM